MDTVAALILFVAVTAYCLFGGADFGAGVWDLVAGGTERGDRPRKVIDRAVGPVWEANHVWLIFVFVVLWTCFPEAYASIWLTLFVPLTLAAFGIVVRGASFAFRKAVLRTRERRAFGALFAISSLLVPFLLGAVAGAVATGRVPAGGRAGDPWTSWINPTSMLGGGLAIAVVSFLAATYLVRDAARFSERDMTEYFRIRAIGSGLACGAIAIGGVFVLHADATYLYHGLTSRALPFAILSAACGIAALALLVRRAHRGARLAAVIAVTAIVIAWGVAQWDYVLPTTLTVSQAAAPTPTLTTVLVATICAVVIVFPAFGLLYTLDQRSMLPEEGVATEGA